MKCDRYHNELFSTKLSPTYFLGLQDDRFITNTLPLTHVTGIWTSSPSTYSPLGNSLFLVAWEHQLHCSQGRRRLSQAVHRL